MDQPLTKMAAFFDELQKIAKDTSVLKERAERAYRHMGLGTAIGILGGGLIGGVLGARKGLRAARGRLKGNLTSLSRAGEEAAIVQHRAAHRLGKELMGTKRLTSPSTGTPYSDYLLERSKLRGVTSRVQEGLGTEKERLLKEYPTVRTRKMLLGALSHLEPGAAMGGVAGLGGGAISALRSKDAS